MTIKEEIQFITSYGPNRILATVAHPSKKPQQQRRRVMTELAARCMVNEMLRCKVRAQRKGEV